MQKISSGRNLKLCLNPVFYFSFFHILPSSSSPKNSNPATKMQFPKWNQSENLSSTSKKPLNPTLEQTLHNFQNHCSGFLHNLSKTLQNHHHHHHHHLNLPFLNPNSSTFKPHFQISLENFINQAKQTFERSISGFSSGGRKPPVWARISSQNETLVEPVHRFDIALSNEDIVDRLAGVPVYALTNSDEEFVLVSGARAKKSLGFFCFSEEDAKALLEELRSMNPEMRRGSKIVPIALNKVIQLKNIEGVSFRFIPDSSQIMNAVKEKQKAGASDVGITGVPVFQSQSLILRSENKTYRPFFFRKEDLEDSLLRAAQHQSQLNPALRKGDIKVSVLEDIITTMQESSTSKWDDVVFIPPGFDVATVIPRKERLTATG